jgi:hypothetical protein
VIPSPATVAAATPETMERPADLSSAHPLEASDRLAWQATAAVGLLERFGDLVLVALDAAGDGDDDCLRAALAERGRLMVQLEPLLAELAMARQMMSRDELAGPNARRALATILQPVDHALRYANLLHARLADELTPAPAPAPVVPAAPAASSDARPVRRGPLALVR